MFEAFTLIAGPCVLEDDGLNLRVAEELARLRADLGIPVVFKASFDKANRAQLASARGPGIEEGLARLARVRETTGLPVLTDIHEVWQAPRAAAVADVLQIPAFLCRQTDLIVAAGATGKAVNIKKGQWVAAEQMAGAVEKARAGGARDVAVTERGTFFGYGDLVVDMRSFQRLRAACGVPAIFDGTHSVQQPGKLQGASGGDRRFIRPLVLAAVAAGCDGLFLEVHPNPAEAPSDAASMLALLELQALIEDALAVRGSLERVSARA